jgi:hypothetical protein
MKRAYRAGPSGLVDRGRDRESCQVTTSPEAAATAGWLEANLSAVAEFNAARKILMHQLEVASISTGSIDDLHATATELQAIALLLRALPPVPYAVAESELRAAVDEFASAITDIMLTSQDQLRDDPATNLLERAALHLLQANAHYRAATHALHATVADRAGRGQRAERRVAHAPFSGSIAAASPFGRSHSHLSG